MPYLYVVVLRNIITNNIKIFYVVVRYFDSIYDLVMNEVKKEHHVISSIANLSEVEIDIKDPFSDNIKLVSTKEKIKGVRKFRYLLTDHVNDLRQELGKEFKLLHKI